jgi:uncharacterized membrane protein YidH (DUF202 family)
MNWLYVASNALWIIALAWIVALMGNAHYVRVEKKESLRVVMAQSAQRLSLYLAFALFSVGLGLVVCPIWGKVLWFILAVVCLFSAWRFSHLRNNKL